MAVVNSECKKVAGRVFECSGLDHRRVASGKHPMDNRRVAWETTVHVCAVCTHGKVAPVPVAAPRVRYKNDCILFCAKERTAREVPMAYTACIVTGNADQASEISPTELIREKDANHQVHSGHSATLDLRWCESPCELKILDENNLPRVHICIVNEFTRHQVVRPAPEHTPPPRKKQCTRNLNATHVHQDWLNPKLVGLYRFRHFGNNLRKYYTKTSTCTYKDDTWKPYGYQWMGVYHHMWDWADLYHCNVFAGQRGTCTILWTHTFDLNDACGLCLIWKCESLGIVIELLRFNREKLITGHHSWIRKDRPAEPPPESRQGRPGAGVRHHDAD